MNIQQLQTERRAKLREARALSRKMTAGTPEMEARQIEQEFDIVMTEVDEIDAQLEEQRDAAPAAPAIGVDVTARGSDGGVTDVPEVRTVGLKPEQRMADWINREQPRSEYADLELGAYFRSMVNGAHTDLEKRALTEGTDSAGGYTVPANLSARLIDLLRSESVVNRAGAVTVPLTSDQNVIAKLATDPVPAWRSENAAIAESDPTFSSVTLTPRSLAVMIKVSRELLADSLNLERELPRIMAVAMAKEWDRVALLGSGTAPEPEGVANATGIGTAALSGALTSYAPFITARTAIKTANANPTAYILHPRDEGTLAGLTASDSQPLMAPKAVEQIPMLTTTAIPTNGGTGTDESTIFCGDFRHLILGMRAQIQVEVIREAYAANHQYAFIAHFRGDVALAQPAAFHTTTAVQG
ncbi:phage major capsid protein [Aliiruegeria lutimaris]|uniref:Phage major capsid protein, HK97 family n=1 Tax=Aliiruegeria lutimaris TaxID=571298 RepID=A0A1G9GC13_9RHOB|nr:phage major capsid protein [Aliiruegeria lutimaris]SDK98167.1 phage major capsid protein, HK97 family [Aliiruegeria lutimaris]